MIKYEILLITLNYKLYYNYIKNYSNINVLICFIIRGHSSKIKYRNFFLY